MEHKGTVLTTEELMKERSSKYEFIDFKNTDDCTSMIYNPTEELKYPIGGYAPGNYMCNCTTCKTQFIGDKRAVQCEPCAVKMVEEQSQLLIESNRISAEKEENRVEWIVIMYKQNLNGRETEDELFEAGVRAGIRESYSLEDMEEMYNYRYNNYLPYEKAIEKFRKKRK